MYIEIFGDHKKIVETFSFGDKSNNSLKYIKIAFVCNTGTRPFKFYQPVSRRKTINMRICYNEYHVQLITRRVNVLNT